MSQIRFPGSQSASLAPTLVPGLQPAQKTSCEAMTATDMLRRQSSDGLEDVRQILAEMGSFRCQLLSAGGLAVDTLAVIDLMTESTLQWIRHPRSQDEIRAHIELLQSSVASVRSQG